MEASVGMHEFSQHQSRAEKILVEAERTGRRTMDNESTGSLQNQWPYKGGCMYSFKSALTSPRRNHVFPSSLKYHSCNPRFGRARAAAAASPPPRKKGKIDESSLGAADSLCICYGQERRSSHRINIRERVMGRRPLRTLFRLKCAPVESKEEW